MKCGLHPEDCVADHWCPALGARPESGGWRAACPVCKTERALTITVRAGGILWCCHRRPACSRVQLRDALAVLLPGCLPGKPGPRPRRDMVPRAELEKLIGLSGAALELRVACLAWNCTSQEAADKLGMPGRTYRRAVTAWPNLARNPR